MLLSLPQHQPRLLVALDGSWFQVDDEAPVSIATRGSLRRLLLALLERRGAPDAFLSSTAAFAAGWPGERAIPKAAATRVYTAIHTLRRFGLASAIRRQGTGYTLCADVRIADAALPETPSSEVRIKAASPDAPDALEALEALAS
jgi:hypothetical protein